MNISYLEQSNIYCNVLSGFLMMLYNYKYTNKMTKILGFSVIFSNTPGTILYNSNFQKLVYILFCYEHIDNLNSKYYIYLDQYYSFINLYKRTILLTIFILTLSNWARILFTLIEKIFELNLIYVLYQTYISINNNGIYTKLYDYHKQKNYCQNPFNLISDYRFNIIRKQKEYEDYKQLKLINLIREDIQLYKRLLYNIKTYLLYSLALYTCSHIHSIFLIFYIYNLNRVLFTCKKINKFISKFS